MQLAKETFKKNREESLKRHCEAICRLLPNEQSRCLRTAQEKGASSWLSALPLRSLGYSLNKRVFLDALRLQNRWPIPDMPAYCGCGKRNSIDHSLNCKLGGYDPIHHNNIRDTEARIMAFDVKVEPVLQKVSKNIKLSPETKTDDNARADTAARGIFSGHELTFFDVRISNPNAPSNRTLPLTTAYIKNKAEKMKAYGNRILQVEKGSFVLLVYSTSGRMGPQCEKTHKRIAELVAYKRNEKYADLISQIRTRL